METGFVLKGESEHADVSTRRVNAIQRMSVDLLVELIAAAVGSMNRSLIGSVNNLSNFLCRRCLCLIVKPRAQPPRAAYAADPCSWTSKPQLVVETCRSLAATSINAD